MFDKNNIPQELHILITLVETWGISVDYDREEKVESATDSEILELTKIGEELSNNTVFIDWLYDQDSFSDMISSEYAAYTNFTMAIDSANFEAKKRKLVRE